MLTNIPCIYMRAGSSKGPFFRLDDLPEDQEVRNKVLLAVMGSPDVRQIDGLGGASTLSSKVAIVSKSLRPGIDVDYQFAQVDIGEARVDTSPSCGNMASAVGPFAIESGLVKAEDGVTQVRIYDINTSACIESLVETPGGLVNYRQGNAKTHGVPGFGAPIFLNYMDIVGSKTGALLPTGNLTDTIDKLEVTMIDVGVPMVLIRAKDLGLTGYENNESLNSNIKLMALIEGIRIKAGSLMGLGDVRNKVIPKVSLLAPPKAKGSIMSRYMTPHTFHAAHAVLGGFCVSTASFLVGSIASELAILPDSKTKGFMVEHPSGVLDIQLQIDCEKRETISVVAGIIRTARPIMRGSVIVPSSSFIAPMVSQFEQPRV